MGQQQEFAHVGRHAEDLAGGRVLLPGERIKLSAAAQDLKHNKRLIDGGKLAPVSSKTAKKEEETDDAARN